MLQIKTMLLLILFSGGGYAQTPNKTDKSQNHNSGYYKEQYRPQIHFSPPAHWMNDPNGMVYINGTYHLFYQHFPDSTIWGPMHWGHAISKDLIHWEHQPIAIYPDSLGYIFSGSAVVDSFNTSGFGKNGKVPIVAIFTHHNPNGQKAGASDFQNQSLAYSLDEGRTWTKYKGNPVLRNPGIKDFRDPKVAWFPATRKWIMTLATKDRVTFFSSPDLKSWTKESEFGAGFGAHGGVWECPDLFPLSYKGKTHWILLSSINPGGPNGGSATQYFVGSFNGKTFTPYQTDTRWIDFGPDDYAGVTWGNTGNRKIFLGWMSNWQYANVVPTKVWRSANTLPRQLSLQKVDEKFLLASLPLKELSDLNLQSRTIEKIEAKDYDLTQQTGKLSGPVKMKISGDELKSFEIIFSNSIGENLVVGFDKTSNKYFIDRTRSGKIDFEKGFGKKHTAPHISKKECLDLTLIIDASSVEIFADGGLTVMTEIFFPNQPYTFIKVHCHEPLKIKTLQYTKLKSIWQ